MPGDRQCPWGGALVNKPGGGRAAAFFDLDKTLISANSGRLWMLRERREGRIGLRHLAMGALYVTLYHFGRVDMERAMTEALATIRGETEDEVRTRTERWWAEDVAPWVAPLAQEAVERHRAEGHRLVLLTSSSPYATACAMETFALDDGISSVYELEDGRFTGRFVAPLCYGEGKVTRAEAFAREHDIDLDASYFYSDSSTDLPMLRRVRNPRIVNPDPGLRRVARREGWPIHLWPAASEERRQRQSG